MEFHCHGEPFSDYCYLHQGPPDTITKNSLLDFLLVSLPNDGQEV